MKYKITYNTWGAFKWIVEADTKEEAVSKGWEAVRADFPTSMPHDYIQIEEVA